MLGLARTKIDEGDYRMHSYLLYAEDNDTMAT